MFGLALFDWLKIGTGALVGAVLAFGGLSTYWTVYARPAAVAAGAKQERAAALERSMELVRERSATNEEIGRMPDGDLCAALGGQWLPDKAECR